MKKIFVTLLSVSLVSVSFINAANLSKGMSGDNVRALQEVLVKSNVGFNANNVTGYYGPLTAKAVANLQSKYGIESVGYVGSKTNKVINILSQLNQLPANQNTYTQNTVIKNGQNSNNIANVNTNTTNQIVATPINSARGSVNVIASSLNTTSNTVNTNQEETRVKSDDYKRVLNNNMDVKTGFVKPSFATTTNGVTKIIVRYKTSPTLADENQIISTRGNKKKVSNLVPIISAEVSDADIDKISKGTNVLSIEKDEPISMQSDLEYANTWGVTDEGSKTVYATGVKGTGVKVAILDTGIDYNHTDLNSNYVGGYNFVTGTTDPLDDNGHGTHVAGTIAALNNGMGVVGVAPEAKIYALKILDAAGNGYSSNVISALDWAVNNGVQVVNVSFGTPVYPGTALEDAFIRAEAKGLVIVAASGNAGTCAGNTDTVYYPAKFTSVISVGAIDNVHNHACFSSAGVKVELSAPGASINSTVVGGIDAIYSGTSMASPHVAGAAAALISAGVKDLNGNGLINDEVRNILYNTSLDLGIAGRDNIYGFGLVKIDNAIAYLASVNNAPAVLPVATSTIVNTPAVSPIIVQPVITNPIPVITQPIITTPVITNPTPIISPIINKPVVTTPVATPVNTFVPAPITYPAVNTTPYNNVPAVTNPYYTQPISNSDSFRKKQELENELENIKRENKNNSHKTENNDSSDRHR